MDHDLNPGSASLEELIAITRPQLRKIFASYQVPASDADDIVQEALIVTLRKWPIIRNKTSWLVMVVRLKCASFWRNRRANRLQAVDQDFLEALAPALPPAQERGEMFMDLERLAVGLSPKQRSLLALRYLEGYSTRECAALLGYDFSSVRKVSSRALAKILAALAASYFGGSGEEDPEANQPPGPGLKSA